ncbi:MAG: hypothetical protein Phog2KO_34670 [Phototrophicaceae bacterium]
MKKRPSAIWHMIKWGFGSGFILALAYFIVLSDIFNSGFNIETLGILISPFGWYLALIFGGLPGAFMGLVVGTLLSSLMREVNIPFTKADMIAKRGQVYVLIFALTFTISAFLVFTFFGGIFNVLLAVPLFIAAIASAYAAHRYMFRLRLWSGGIETGKVKAKNDAIASSRLIENKSQQIDYYTTELDAENQRSEQKS